MPATDALTVRTELTEQLQTQAFQSLVRYYCQLESENKTSDLQASRFHSPENMSRALKVAETFYVSPDMCQVAMKASENFPEDEVILKEDQPSEGGFIYFAERFRMLELRGRLTVVHAALWMNNRLWLLTDRNDPDDEISAIMRADQSVQMRDQLKVVGRYDVCGIMGFQFGQTIPKTVVFKGGVLPPEAKVEFKQTATGMAMYTDHPLDPAMIPGSTETDPFMRFMLSLWRLMQQTLASVHTEDEHPRPVRRRAQRSQVPTGVTVISLRRRAQDHHEGTGLGINYRTLVRGHWRRVWCGPHDGERYQRAVFIHSFVRGPSDAPLIIRERVNALIR